MKNLILRKYNSLDREFCRKLWKELTQYHRNIYNDPSIGGDTPEDYFDKHLNKIGSQYIWIAEFNGEVIGFAGLILDEKEAEIEPIIVSTQHRGKGVGKALIEEIISEAKQIGAKFISVKPVARNFDAIRFYFELGFRNLGEIEMFIDLRPSESKFWEMEQKLFGLIFKY